MPFLVQIGRTRSLASVLPFESILRISNVVAEWLAFLLHTRAGFETRSADRLLTPKF